MDFSSIVQLNHTLTLEGKYYKTHNTKVETGLMKKLTVGIAGTSIHLPLTLAFFPPFFFSFLPP